MVEGFRGADCLVASASDGGQARLLVPLEQLETTALLLGCDPSLGIVTEHLARRDPRGRLAWISASSRAALQAIRQGAAHVAGSHIRDPLTGMFNVKQAAEALAGSGGLVVGFASWEQGLMVAPGNPRRLRKLEDLARKGLSFVNREAGAGSREILDHLLEAAGVPAEAVSGYERTAETHLAVARMVAGGGADAGMGLRAVAAACGLDFVPLLQVDFDLSIPADHLEHPVVARLLELLNGRALRADVGALPGYEVGRMGVVLARVPGSAPAGPSQQRAPVRRPRVRKG
jgi:molybdate-binding protein